MEFKKKHPSGRKWNRLLDAVVTIIKYKKSTIDHAIYIRIFTYDTASYPTVSTDDVLVISSIENIISGDCKVGHCTTSKKFDVDSMINCALLILKNSDHCIKESIPLSSIWLCSLD